MQRTVSVETSTPSVETKVMGLIRNFFYRLPRFKTECAMDFILGDNVILGVCLSLSESGLRGTLSHPVPAGSEGLLTLYQGDQNCPVQARISSLRDGEVLVVFEFHSEQERVALRDFLNLLTRPPRR